MKKFYKSFAVAFAAAAMIMLGSSVNVSAAGVKDVFDAEYYADSYEDLKATFGYNEAALYNHYITLGLTEGRCATIIRFPGGSYNTISRNYCSGIMSALTGSTASMGYLYADWNVYGGDGGETTSTAQVKANVINGLKANSVSVVLLHDTQGFSVNAVEDIIVWGLANGYTFLPMDDTSPMAHHGVNN